MRFIPTSAFGSVFDITPQILKKMGIRGVILDIDNTLARHNDPEPLKDLDKWISSMKKSGIRLVIVSNNKAPRVSPFAERIGVPFVSDGAKPLPIGYHRAAKLMRLPKSMICTIGDQIFTDMLGAKLYGIKPMLVIPIEPEKSVFFRIKRLAEKPFLPKTYHIRRK